MKKNTRIKGAINRRKRKASKYNLGGAYSNPTLPMSSSTMAGIPGQQQAQQEFQNLQMQSARARRMNERAQQLEQEAAEQKTKDDFQQSASAYGSTALQGIGKAADAFRASEYAAQNAAIASQAGGQTSNLLGILGQQSLNTPKMGMGQSLLQGAKGLGKTGGGAVLGLAGAGIQRLSDDQDETTLNVGETTGTLMKGAGAGLGLAGTLGSFAPALAIPGIGWAAAGIGAGIAGVKALKNRNEQRDIQAEEEEQQRINDLRMGRAQNAAFRQGFTQSGIDQGYNIGNSMTNSYIPGYQMAKYGGKKVSGGEIQGMPGGAKKFVGKSHEQGGIMLDPQTEVEGGETMDKVKMSDGDKSDYIFSKTLRLGGKSFAQRHEEILRRGGSKGRMQKKIQDLAKMQEAVAAKQGKDENGPRDPNMIAKMQDGGEVEDKFDDTVLPGSNVLSAIPEGQSIFTDGLYTQDQGFILDQVKERNPWFDWGDFDPSNAEDVKRFQQAYNDKVPKDSEVTVDGKFGDQTASIYLDMKEIDRIGKQDYTPKDKEGEEKTEEKTEEPADKEESSEEVFTPKSKMDMMPGTLAALSGLAQLPRKLKAPPKAANITPQQTGKIKLPRVNYNAERAAGAAGTTSVNRAIQNQAAGPGGIAAMIANTDRQRQNNIQIANAEAQANKQLMSQETMTNAQIAQQNAANAMNAQQFNEQSKYARDLENYQQNLLRQQAIGKTIAGVGKDFMGYRSDERLATAMDDVGAYQRFIEQNKTNSKTENRNGGKRKYISKSNKVRRKKK